MISSGNELNVSSKTQFFNNSDVPYALKAGMAAVMSHATIDYYKTKDGHDSFQAIFFDKEEINGKTVKSIKGNITFDFGVESSMGKDNCAASIKQFVDLYPAVGNLLDDLSDKNFSAKDEEVCKVLADASAKRFNFSVEGVEKNYNEYVSGVFDEYVKQVKAHYPGLVSAEVFDNLKSSFEGLCKKKKSIAQNNDMN